MPDVCTLAGIPYAPCNAAMLGTITAIHSHSAAQLKPYTGHDAPSACPAPGDARAAVWSMSPPVSSPAMLSAAAAAAALRPCHVSLALSEHQRCSSTSLCFIEGHGGGSWMVLVRALTTGAPLPMSCAASG